MASKEHELAIKIAGKVDASLGGSIDQVNSKLSQLGKMAKLAGKIGISKIGTGIANTAKLAAAGIGTATAAAGGLAMSAINVGKQFESSMSQVQATMLLDTSTAEGQQAYKTLENAARECGATTAFSAVEAAEGLNYLALAGYDVEKAATALPTILKLAGAGAMDLSSASDMVTDAMSALNMEATQDNLSMFSDQLAKAASKSNTSVAQLGEAILTVGGTANTLSGGLTEANTAISILSDNGVKSSEAGTALRNVILSLTAPTDKAAGKLEELGVKVADSTGNMRSLEDIMYDLNMAVGTMGKVERQSALNEIFNKVDLKSVSALMAATTLNIDGLGSSLSKMGIKYSDHSAIINQIATDYNTLGDRTEATEMIMKDMGVSTEQANAIFDTIVQNCGKATNRFQQLSAAINDSKGACDEMYATQLDNLEGDIAILQSGLADLGITFYQDTKGPIREVTQLASNMINALGNAYKGTKENPGTFQDMIEQVGPCLATMTTAVASYIPQMVETGVTIVDGLIQGITSNLPTLVSAGTQAITAFVSGVVTIVPQLILAGTTIITQLMQGITTQIPQLINSGTQTIASFAQGFSTAFPQMMQAGAQLISSLIDGIGQNASSLISSGVQIIGSLAIGILQALPQVISSGAQLILSLIQGIVNNLPQIIQVATTAILCFIEGVVQALPSIVEASVQIIVALVDGLANNIENIAIAGGQIIMALLTGIIRALPTLVSGLLQIVITISQTLTSASWWLDIGKKLIIGIVKGIASMGSLLWDTIKSLFLGGDPPDLSQYGVEAAQSYNRGLEQGMSQQNAQKLLNGNAWTNANAPQLEQAGISAGTAYARGINQGINASNYPALDILKQQQTTIPVPDNTQAIQAMAQSGQASADAYTQSLQAGLGDINIDSGIDTSAITSTMSTAGTESGTAYTESLDTTISSYTLGVNVDTSQAVTSFNVAGSDAGNAFNQALTAALSSIDFTTILNVSTIPPIFTQAGTAGGNALATAITASQGIVLGAVQAMCNAIQQAFAAVWQSVISTAQSSLASLTSICASEAQRAASAIKQAFEGMTITVPKPRIPQISVSTSTVSYGEGGSVSVPNFSVAWNAKGGIFDRPTIFNTSKGLQGVGEAGPEAIMPLDTLWSKLDNIMQETFNDSHDETVTIEYKPTYQFYGGTPSKKDIMDTETMSQAKFNKMLDRYYKDKKRTSFA